MKQKDNFQEKKLKHFTRKLVMLGINEPTIFLRSQLHFS